MNWRDGGDDYLYDPITTEDGRWSIALYRTTDGPPPDRGLFMLVDNASPHSEIVATSRDVEALKRHAERRETPP